MQYCTITGCNRVHKAKSLCSRHYQRLRSHGSTDGSALHSHLHGGDGNHPLYSTYTNMLSRCANKRRWNYQHYGARGIGVCERWLSETGFPNFVADMGDRPDGYSLDRVDVNGPYSPENCRWASKFTQMANTRSAGKTPGVTYDRRRRNWRARVKVKGHERYIGAFQDLASAVEACAKYRREMGYE